MTVTKLELKIALEIDTQAVHRHNERIEGRPIFGYRNSEATDKNRFVVAVNKARRILDIIKTEQP